MKIKHLYPVLFTLLMSFIVLNKKQVFQYDENNYTIVKIDSVEHVYIVYAEKTNSIYKIISKKVDMIDCQPLEIGGQYDLELNSWFLPEEFHVKNRMTGIRYEGVLIIIERDSIVSDIFTTKNLGGLCYLKKR
jgi:hypothetical protein